MSTLLLCSFLHPPYTQMHKAKKIPVKKSRRKGAVFFSFYVLYYLTESSLISFYLHLHILDLDFQGFTVHVDYNFNKYQYIFCKIFIPMWIICELAPFWNLFWNILLLDNQHTSQAEFSIFLFWSIIRDIDHQNSYFFVDAAASSLLFSDASSNFLFPRIFFNSPESLKLISCARA